MKHRDWVLGIFVGAVGGLVVAVAATAWDWRMNPGGVFVTATGTDWSAVWETLRSWWLPSSAIAMIATWIARYLHALRGKPSTRTGTGIDDT